MTRALLVCPEPLGHGQPAGIGIRFLEMAKVLLADGHGVTLLSRDAGPVDGCITGAITPENLLRYSNESDVAIVQGHVANDLFAHARPLPVVVDLYDPFIIENLHYYATRGAEVFTHDHATLMLSLARGDLFLCASEAQRLFYLGMLLAVGRLNPIAFSSDARLASLVRIAPFGVAPPAELPHAASNDILFGGIYDWYDPLLAIDAVALLRQRVPDATLTFTHHPNASITPQGKLAEAMAHVKKQRCDFVRFEAWVAYEQRAAFFARFAAALLTFRQSLETDLSMRTRIYDYLWGGLPIVTSSAPGTDELLTRYGAGAIVQTGDAQAFADALVDVLQRRDVMRAGARAFASQHQWQETLAPLVDFVRAPRIDREKETFAVRLQTPEHPPSILHRLKRRIGVRS